MTEIIKIKRSNTISAPSSLNFGEMAYTEVGGVKRLFVGQADNSTAFEIDIMVVKRQAWTPTDASGAGLSFSQTSNSVYNYANGTVQLHGEITYPTNSDTNVASIGGLPIDNLTNSVFVTIQMSSETIAGQITTLNKIVFFKSNNHHAITNADLSGSSIIFDVVYISKTDFGS